MDGHSARVTLRNSLIVARREFTWRARSRTFLISTVFLMVVATAVALAPTIIRYFNRMDAGQTIGVYVGDAAPSVAFAPALEALLDSTSAASGSIAIEKDTGAFKVVDVPDVSGGRARVQAGELKAVLALRRTAGGDLGYTLYSGMQSFERTPQLIQQAAAALAMQDRLARAGIAPGDQAALFAAPAFDFAAADPAESGSGSQDLEKLIGGSLIGFALTIFIFMAIILYGQWVAMSVAEEKSSRVIEIVLGAAKPFELMAGKVVGTGAAGMVQYVAVMIPATVAIFFEAQIARAILGGEASVGLPAGLTIPVLLALGVFLLLGFALYACLYAAAASLVSRMEDVNQVVGPLTLISTLGYLVAVYSSSGLIPIDSPVVIVLSYIPFLSPFVMLSRMTAGETAPIEPIAAALILAATVVVALWFAGRLYSAGIFMYGQKPSLRNLIKAARSA
jgi:ABC-2 type transport system permease protein